MNGHLSLVQKKNNTKTSITNGLAPVVCYDPWFPRALESIKQSVHDGHPVLIRLHSAASYPFSSNERYTVDLESHAVLVVGYDDSKGALAVIDPWDKNWGGKVGGRRWISYSAIETQTVNTSLGLSMPLSPLSVHPETHRDDSGNFSIQLKVGFYIPRGTIMDRKSWTITKVNVCCNLPESWEGKQLDYEIAGCWTVGDSLQLSLPIANSPLAPGEIKLNVSATIQGKRPYDFEDVVSVQEKIFVNTVQPVINELQNLPKMA